VALQMNKKLDRSVGASVFFHDKSSY